MFEYTFTDAEMGGVAKGTRMKSSWHSAGSCLLKQLEVCTFSLQHAALHPPHDILEMIVQSVKFSVN